MSGERTGRRTLLDPRLARRVSVTPRYLLTSVAVGIASTVAVVAQAVLFATVSDQVIVHGASLGQVAPQLWGLAAAFVARALFVWAGQMAAHATSATVTRELRRQMLRRVLDLGPAWLGGERTGELSLTATRGIEALDVYFGRYLPQVILAVLAPIGLLAWIGWEDWPSFLILLGLVLVVPPAMIVFGREAASTTGRQWRIMASLSGRFLELIQGLPTLRAVGRTALGRREVAEANEGLRRATMRTLRVAFVSSLALELLAGLGTGLVAMVLGLRLLNGSIPLYTAFAVLLVSPEVFLPLRRAGADFHASTEGQTAATRILDLLDQAETADLPTSGEVSRAPDPSSSAVEFRSVGFTYPGRSSAALDRLDLVLEPGEQVALVGPSGAGKSTLLALLLRFVVPDAGSLVVGDVDLAGVDPAAWRQRVAWVPQRPHLFRGTVADNLRMGDPAASDDALESALELVGLERLAEGLATPVGEHGLTLSVGERQRVALARAVLRDAPLVLLDEPTAHLDPTAVLALRGSLGPWLARRTVVLAAHQPDLLQRVDRTVELAAPGPAEGAAVGQIEVEA